jgi:hypothetical protein
MTSRSYLGAAAAAAATATLAFPGAAGATAGKRTFEQTYPVASRLCAEVAQGRGPKRLHRAAAQVLADCSGLHSSFNASRTAVLAIDASLASQGAAARAGLAAPCKGATAHRIACNKAHRNDRRVLESLGRQRIRAAHLYYASIEASRLNFWSAIRALPGGRGLREDRPIHAQDS